MSDDRLWALSGFRASPRACFTSRPDGDYPGHGVKSGLAVLLANVPTLICAGIGGLLADRGHPWFATAFLLLAYTLAHAIQRKDAE